MLYMHILDFDGEERFDGMATDYMFAVAYKHLSAIQFLTVATMSYEEMMSLMPVVRLA